MFWNIMRDLPEELAIAFPEGHHHAFMSLHIGIARLGVVGGDEDFAVRDHGTADCPVAQLGHPLDVLAFACLDAPVVREFRIDCVDHVAARTAAEHRPGALGFTAAIRTSAAGVIARHQEGSGRHQQERDTDDLPTGDDWNDHGTPPLGPAKRSEACAERTS